jgi:glycosyltransferase involved in cell wall biosynthesis
MSDRPVNVMMLGWEFPPFITGGLGTACHGLTKALDELGAQVTFVLPKGVAGESAQHVRLVAPGLDPEPVSEAQTAAVRVEDFGPAPLLNYAAPAQDFQAPGLAPNTPSEVHLSGAVTRARQLRLLTAPFVAQGGYTDSVSHRLAQRMAQSSAAPHRALRPGSLAASRIGISGALKLPPGIPEELFDGVDDHTCDEMLAALEAWEELGSQDPAEAIEFIQMLRAVRAAVPEAGGRGSTAALGRGGTAPDYSGDLLAQSEAYAQFCVETCRDQPFDVIHAHDWLTYPAGIALARVTGRPLVVHVHSTEFDRSGTHVNQPVYNIERRGMHSAVRVITVSMLTRNICHNRYGIPVNKCDVVYNGVELDPVAKGLKTIAKKDHVVLFFGRITMQKGPEYFVHAAKRVLDVMDDVKFVVAGSGDQAQSMIELAAAMGIGHKMLFTGFLRGKDIQRVFQIADVYVMPSVSEPFGIAPLEALGHRVPVLISRQSGVSEVLQNALKFDFWDTEDLANKIVAVLRHPPLRRTLREEGFDEVRGITWQGAARKTMGVYRKAMDAVARRHA